MVILLSACVGLVNYFQWSEIANYNSNFYWIDQVISWEDSSFLLNGDLFVFFAPLIESFYSNFFSTSFTSNLSLVDFIFVSAMSSQTTSALLVNYYTDLAFEFFTMFSKLSWLFYSSYGDIFLINFFANNEIIFIITDWVNVINSTSFDFTPETVYSEYFFTVSSTSLDYLLYFKWLVISLVILIMFTNLIQSSKFANVSFYFFTRLFNFFTSLAFENRLQYDWTVLFLSFVFILWIPLLMTYDDVNVELVELFHQLVCVVFLLAIALLLFKYSTHYFAFLENSVSDGYSVSYIAKQFVRDVSNTFALFLRFFLLIFRLNIYDGLDDFLDSYFIFFIDFDEDSYWDELLIDGNFYNYFSDNHEDVLFYSPTELDWVGDIYSKYFIIWGKFFMFFAFILEEAFRVSLAFYISYLIIFEVHSVNVSYSEDNFLSKKN